MVPKPLKMRTSSVIEKDPDWTEDEVAIAEIWASLLDVPVIQIRRDDRFTELGGDSILSAELIYAMRLEWPNLHETIPQLISENYQLTDLAAYLSTGGALIDENGNRSSSTNDPNYITSELSTLSNPTLTWNPKAQILLTGATGYLGSSLLMELLEKTERNIYCFIRSDCNEGAGERLSEILYGYNWISKRGMLPSRVIPIAADLSEPLFGLDKSVYNKLATGIDVIYHCAAEVNLLKSFDDLKGPNIQGTKEILKLAMEKKIKPLHYVSTVGVFAHYMDEIDQIDSSKEYPEKRLSSNLNLTKYITGYSQTKAVAELLVWHAIDLGHPAIIYRPGEIGCHSVMKVINRSDFLYIMLQACAEINRYPIDFDWKFAYGSLEFITKSIANISTKAECFGKVFHVIEENLNFSDFFKTDFGSTLKRTLLVDWKKEILGTMEKSRGKERKRSSSNLVSLFLFKEFYQNMNYFEISNSHAGTFANKKTIQFLQKHDELQNIKNSPSFLTTRYSELIADMYE